MGPRSSPPPTTRSSFPEKATSSQRTWLRKVQTCAVCETEFAWKCPRTYCSPACRADASAARRKVVELPCLGCGVIVSLAGRRLFQARSNRVYCSGACSRLVLRPIHAKTMAATNRKHASARMTKDNPMARPESRAKMVATLRRIGHQPKVLGGNGRGPTLPELAMSEAIGWPTNLIVVTKQVRGSGYPYHYKIDVGNAELKVAIEIDGPSHGALVRQAQDAKKDAFLRTIGWRVFRFTNREVMADSAACARTVLSTI